MTEERGTELKDKTIEICPRWKAEKRLWKINQCLVRLHKISKHIIGASEGVTKSWTWLSDFTLLLGGEEREQSRKKVPEEIIAECFPNLVKVRNVLDTKFHANKTTMSTETPRLSCIVVNC